MSQNFPEIPRGLERAMLIENPLNESPLVFPVLEYIHIIGFTCGVGTIALVNFRLLGIGLTKRSAAQLWRAAMPWTLLGLTLAISSGLLLFSVNPDVYYLNYTFLAKMCFVAVAILFHFTAIRRAVAAESSGFGRAAAWMALALWAVVLFGGIFIGLSATRPPAAAPPPTGIDFNEFLHK